MTYDPSKREADWQETHNRMAALWPEWKPNAAQLDLFRTAIIGLNQDWVRQAVRRVATRRTWREPKLADVLSSFREIRDENRVHAVDNEVSNRHGKRTAEDAEARQEDADTLRILKRWAVDELRKWKAIVVDTVGDLVTGRVDNASDDPARWSPMLRGFVLAASQYTDAREVELREQYARAVAADGLTSDHAMRLYWMWQRQLIMLARRPVGSIPNVPMRDTRLWMEKYKQEVHADQASIVKQLGELASA